MPQSLSSLLVHLIFSTKERQPWITPAIEQELFPYMATVMKGCDSPALIINGTADHLHLLIALARTWRLCDVVEEVKKRSSKWIKTKGSHFRGLKGATARSRLVSRWWPRPGATLPIKSSITVGNHSRRNFRRNTESSTRRYVWD